MSSQDLVAVFREKLRAIGTEGKYARRFSSDDEERICRALAMALENPALSETLLFEQLTGDKA